jgi:hypothetical protein
MSGRDKDHRPFRIFDEGAKRDLPWRAYIDKTRAINKCLTLLWWLEIGNSYTVYDSRSSKAVAQFTRKVSGIHTYKEAA